MGKQICKLKFFILIVVIFACNLEATITTPNKIDNCEELQNINANLTADYELTRNIDCSNTTTWNSGAGFAPIGDNDQNSFKGSLDGNNYIISRLYINRPATDHVALFGHVFNTGRINNLGLENVRIKGHTGVAGLLAWNLGGKITNCHVTGYIWGTGLAVGGLVGQNGDGVITNSYSSGYIKGVDFVGGLVGSNYKIILNCYSNAKVDTTAIQYSAVGGLVGSNWDQVTKSFSVGIVAGNVNETSGGLIGYSLSYNKTIDSYWDIETSGKTTSMGGLGRSTYSMKQRSTYSGWDFYKSWSIIDGETYPFFRSKSDIFQVSFSMISSPQKVKVPFNITLSTNDHSSFNGTIYLYCNRGKVNPTRIQMSSGHWSGQVTLYSEGKDNHLSLRWYTAPSSVASSDSGTASSSSTFDVTDPNGTIPKNSILIGHVVDENQKVIVDANVLIYSEDPLLLMVPVPAMNSTVTDSDGNYQFNNLRPETIYLKVNKLGYRDSVKRIDTASNLEVTGNIILYSGTCSAPTVKDIYNYSSTDEAKIPQVPILLVPGIMGSKSSGVIYPSLPKITPKWNDWKLKLHDPLWGWKFLKSILKLLSYKEDCTLFDVPYDWTLSIEDIRDQFLIPLIKDAKSISGSDKVDIIAHSMGGLVVRSYIQSPNYAHDIRKFAMVGTPSKGSDVSYYMWEGGDPINVDKIFNPITYFYTNTLYYLYKDRMSEEVCTFLILKPFRPKSCKKDKLYNFLHQSARSIGQLIPIYNEALLDYKTVNPVTIEKEENSFLKSLNKLECQNPSGCLDFFGRPYDFVHPASVLSSKLEIGKVKTKLFVGVGKKTISSIYVKSQPLEYSGQFYKDGVPENHINSLTGGTDTAEPKFNSKGDGTVLKSSVVFNEYFPAGQELKVLEIRGSHSKLINKFLSKIVCFITGSSVAPNSSISELPNDYIVPPPMLVITIEGRVQIVVSPEVETQLEKEIDLFNSVVKVVDPPNGLYSVKFNSPYRERREEFEISVYYIDERNFFEVRKNGYYDGWSCNIWLRVNSTKNSSVVTDRTFETPTNLQIHNNSDTNFVQLTWEDTHTDLVAFGIYWKRKDEAYFQELVRIEYFKARTYQTNHTWEEAKNNVYVIKAFLQNRCSTFFSEPTSVE